MEIKHERTGSKGSFYIEENNIVLGKMTYSVAGNHKIIIDHTEVSDALRGKGAGFKLVEASVLYAREHHLTIIPLCPFAHAVFQKTAAFQDVLDKS